MAGLHSQTFHIEVFVSGSLHQIVPDAAGDLSAVIPQTAVERVMRAHQIDFAEVVYIRSDYDQNWMHEVFLHRDGITYVAPVDR